MRESERLASEARNRRQVQRLDELNDEQRELFHLAESFVDRAQKLRDEIGRVVIGQRAVVDELISLIQAQRNYEVNSRTIQVADEMLQQVANLV